MLCQRSYEIKTFYFRVLFLLGWTHCLERLFHLHPLIVFQWSNLWATKIYQNILFSGTSLSIHMSGWINCLVTPTRIELKECQCIFVVRCTSAEKLLLLLVLERISMFQPFELKEYQNVISVYFVCLSKPVVVWKHYNFMNSFGVLNV